ncbi:glycosyltransferase [Sinomonas susongensis]|uniref:glycosyltransferase n=1 Tax=Sinomonas susongensis TaxID=1324851 RepID=UPI001109D1BD|nr:glycosyltransferase [Sinomonas susongensis]
MQRSSRTDHVIVTRFNLPSRGYEQSVRERTGWLEQRVGLFERFCLPSVMAQTSENFAWIAYFDPASPDWLRERIQRWRDASVMTPIFRAEVPPDELLEDLAGVSGARRERLLTTNLDNDDALAVDFVERLQSLPHEPAPAALYLARGLIAAAPSLYLRVDRANAFCSVSARWEDGATCWADWHNELHRLMPTRLGWGQPAWLQVVHGTNVSNRVHGRLTSPAAYSHLFPGLLDEWPRPTRTKQALDRTLRGPLRLGREAARASAKRVIVAAAGRSALDRVRQRTRGRQGPPNAR